MPALKPTQPWQRHEQRSAMAEQRFDVLVIGGGASGAGVFLDALSRGLSAALIDKQDFMAGTSSRSTKLVHGGVRYLEQAVKELNVGKYQLVKEALSERKRMLNMAPHLAWPLNLVTPVKGIIGLPYFRIGLGVYDFLSGSEKIGPSKIEGKKALKAICPDLNVSALTGGVSYFDGQFDDARFGVSMVRTGLEMGGVALNHTEVQQLLFTEGKVSGAQCRDLIANTEFSVHARVVINATGPWSDNLRVMADAQCKKMMTVSSGVHVVIDRHMLPEGKGILVPETEDGRVMFILPWLGKTLIGTTDDPAQLTDNPEVSDAEIDYVLRTANAWLAKPIRKDEVTSVWSGLRPLVTDPNAESTSDLTRDHVVLDDNGLITLTGGKWTTWRSMAQDCVDYALKTREMTAKPCATMNMHLVGAQGDTLGAQHAIAHLPADVREHLWQAYGDRAAQVIKAGSEQRIVEGAPYIEAELVWALQYEGAITADDVLNRRLRVNMLDTALAEKMRPFIDQLIERYSHAA